jgi:TPR repeat protein
MFRKGLGVRHDPSLAYSLYQQAVRNPDTPDIAENPSYYRAAYYWLGNMAEEGNGIERDLEIAEQWYRLGAGWDSALCDKALDRLRRGRGQ